MSASGLIVAATRSQEGKTVIASAAMRALRRQGRALGAFKVGPGCVDPALHRRAIGRSSYNLDSWAMRFDTLTALFDEAARDAELVIGDGAAGLFDGAPDGQGSTADLASLLGLPVALVVDASRMGASAAALIEGFVGHRQSVDIVALVFNRVAENDHARDLREACENRFSLPILGFLPEERRLAALTQQTFDEPRADAALDAAADLIAQRLDLARLARLARPPTLATLGGEARPLAPLGQVVAVARDAAFAHAYDAVLEGWRKLGAEIAPFSPLANEAPPEKADAVYLPGGDAESHAGAIADARAFLDGVGRAARRGAIVYGECEGYAVLGGGVVDRRGGRHRMGGLLPIATSYRERGGPRGYVKLEAATATPLGRAGAAFRGHACDDAGEIQRDAAAEALFRGRDARGQDLGPIGCAVGNVFGSLAHVIDRTPHLGVVRGGRA